MTMGPLHGIEKGERVPKGRCDDCFFSRTARLPPPAIGSFIECRRYAPQVIATPVQNELGVALSVMSRFPQVGKGTDIEWCWSWQPAPPGTEPAPPKKTLGIVTR